MIVVSLDFWRGDKAGLVSWLPSVAGEYKKHYTHTSFTVPVFQRMLKKLQKNTILITDGIFPKRALERKHRVIFDPDYDNLFAKARAIAPYYEIVWVHYYKVLHAIPFHNPKQFEDDYDAQLGYFSDELKKYFDHFTDRGIVVTADHGIIIDPEKDKPNEMPIPTDIGRRRFCEATLHIPLFIKGEQGSSDYTNHDMLADYLNGQPLVGTKATTHPCFIKGFDKEITYDLTTHTISW